MSHLPIKRALISVSDKIGIIDFAKALITKQVEIISTGGTAALFKENQIPFTPIENVTGNPESFGGRMKTISFQIGSALLFRRNHLDDQKQATELGIRPIDLVICNLYPFEKTARLQADLAELVENIDIGGPTMIRAAAKNFESVACVTDPTDYAKLVQEFNETGGFTLDTRKKMALKTFTLIAGYDLSIAAELTRHLNSDSESGSHPLRYGENPHQKAVVLKINNTDQAQTLANSHFIQGKELSYNNLLDADQSFKCVSELNHQFSDQAACVIVKHGTPCGVALSHDPLCALQLAWESDSMSAFGSIIAFNQTVNLPIAQFLSERFVEVIIAPGFDSEALAILAKKKNLRLLQATLKPYPSHEWTVRSIHGGILCQDEDQAMSTEIQSVTLKPFPEQNQNLARFGLTVTKYLKSNCLGIFGKKTLNHETGLVTITSGVGQPNRLDCITRLAAPKAFEKNESLTDAILVSDAFFPFRDSIEAIQKTGIKTIIQPGGSVRDSEVIAACNEFGIAMAFTGQRHFRH